MANTRSEKLPNHIATDPKDQRLDSVGNDLELRGVRGFLPSCYDFLSGAHASHSTGGNENRKMVECRPRGYLELQYPNVRASDSTRARVEHDEPSIRRHIVLRASSRGRGKRSDDCAVLADNLGTRFSALTRYRLTTDRSRPCPSLAELPSPSATPSLLPVPSLDALRSFFGAFQLKFEVQGFSNQSRVRRQVERKYP